MKNNSIFMNEDIAEIKEDIKQLEKMALEDETKRPSILKTLENIRDNVQLESFNAKTSLEEIELNKLLSTIKKSINTIEKASKGIKNINMSWLKSKAFKKVGLALTSIAGISTIALLVTSCAQKQAEKKAMDAIAASAEKFEEDYDPTAALDKMAEIAKAQVENQTLEDQNQKEEEIINLVKDLTAKFNEFEGLNVTEEQVLSLFIHLNVGNSYMNDNALALDKLTREDLVKKYYVGLTPDTEEFEEYKITDDDLSKLTSNVMELRNELNNYIIVLNDQGKYEESRKILNILNGFITEEALQDEASVLIESVQNIQTNDKKEIKKQAYLWYNYLYAGPKSEVRNFDDYGCYKDIDGKEMTFENQGMTIRFLTWFLNVWVDTSISGKEIIPQDIINDAQAKLLDQANLLRALGYKNCTSFGSIYGIVSDEPLTNGNKKRSYSSSKKSSSSTATSATGNAKVDSEIDSFLQNNTEVGSSFVASDGSTITVTESGPSSITVEQAPNPGSAETHDSTPQGPSSTTTTEGGGGEEVREIEWTEDENTEVIDEGGQVISSGSYTEEVYTETYSESTNESTSSQEETVETMNYEADTQASIRDEINKLLSLREIVTGYTISITEDKPFEKTYTC